MRGILCFGDSITFGLGKKGGWAGRLKDYFEPKGEHNCIFNLGICGDTSRDLLKRFDTEANARIRYLYPEDKHTIIIAIGANDLKGIESPENLNINPAEFRKNILKLISKSKKYTKDIVLIGLIPVNENVTLPYEDTYFSNKIIKEYNSIMRDCCKRNKIRFISLFEEMSKKDYKKMLYDGLHPNNKGYDFMFNKIKEELK